MVSVAVAVEVNVLVRPTKSALNILQKKLSYEFLSEKVFEAAKAFV